MTGQKDTLVINAKVEITAAALQAIVENAKKNTGCDPDGVYRVDTFGKVSQIISRFLFENDFESYAKEKRNCY